MVPQVGYTDRRMARIVLRTDRFALREWTEDDYGDAFALIYGDGGLMHQMSGAREPQPPLEEDARALREPSRRRNDLG